MNDELLDNESEYSINTNRSEHSRHGHKKHHGRMGRHSRNKGEKSVTICAPVDNGHDDLDLNQGLVVVDMPERSQNDSWVETNTLVSATTEGTQLSRESLAKFTEDKESSGGFNDCGYVAMVIFSLISYLSPIAIALVPHLWLDNPITMTCETACKGILIGIAFKFFLLLFASWTMFFRGKRFSLPRVYIFRSLILFLLLLISLIYWLFFAVWIVEQKEENYEAIASFADSYTNCLLFVHYLSLILLELRHLQPSFVLEVIRTTDGERRFYTVGDLSIQRCSVWVLERYYADFPVYNPALLRAPTRGRKGKQETKQNFKFFDVDGTPGEDPSGRIRAVMAAAARRRDAGHNERYYEEAEYERRVRKRRARLVAASEDAFAHIRRVTDDDAGKDDESSMDAQGAAESIFPALARSLQKYLRTTRQHQHYDIASIIEHLSDCIKNDMTSRAFLERYLHPGSYMTYKRSHESSQWQLISDDPLINMIKEGTVFRLSQGDYSLVTTVHRSPRIKLKEKFVESSDHRFLITMHGHTQL